MRHPPSGKKIPRARARLPRKSRIVLMKGFGNIAVASTFSPRFLPLLAEARAFAEKLGSAFSVIHAGKCGAEEEERFGKAFDTLRINPRPRIHCAEGEPAEAILRAATELGVDLLIAGAMEKDVGSRNFLGDVARTLIRNSPISLLLYPRPATEARAFRKLAAIVDFSPLAALALKQTIHLAEKHAADSIHAVRVFTIFDQALSQPDEFFQGAKSAHPGVAAEEEQLARFIDAAGPRSVSMEARCVEGATGFAVSDYVQAIEADLLVISSGLPGSPHPLPQGMDWLFNVIPTNLLVLKGGNAGPA